MPDHRTCAVAANALAGGSAHSVIFDELEREWRALFPLAWVDFYRFLLGWSPGQFDGDPYSEQLTREVVSRFTSA